MDKKKRVILIVVIIIAAAVAASGFFWLKSHNTKSQEKQNTSATVVPWDVEIPEEMPQEAGKILLPGYSSMEMKAGTVEQTVSIGNPSKNNCYFVIVLKLEDGTELFTSDYLKPGEGLNDITLKQTLEPGEKTAVIEYQCYSLEDKSPLNGGSSEFELIVK